MGLTNAFASRIGPDDVTHPKPHPEAVLKSAEALGVAPDEMFFVGDTDFDVLAARAAAVRCVCVTTGYNTRDELLALEPEAVFDSLDEATDYMLEHRNGA
jgi:phosphoglycolate phosphatase